MRADAPIAPLHLNGDVESSCQAASSSIRSNGSCVSQRSLRTLFQKQQQLLSSSLSLLDYGQVANFCQLCQRCCGTLLFTGVGKSGCVAQKAAATFVSFGLRAAFLHPTDALHGDLGVVGADDVVVFLSKSGASDELLRLLPWARAKGATGVAVTCAAGSALAAGCQLELVLPLEREACPWNLAPVTSTALQMLLLDTVAVALMQASRLSLEAYAANHPSGRIGRRLTLSVAGVMLRGEALPSVRCGTLLADALAELTSKGCGCVCVVQEAAPQLRLCGILTDGDLRRGLQRHGSALLDMAVDEVMTPTPRTCAAGDKAVAAMELMENAGPKVSALPVVQDGQLLGLVTLHALVSAGL